MLELELMPRRSRRSRQTSVWLQPEVLHLFSQWPHLTLGFSMVEVAERYRRVMEAHLPDLTPAEWRLVLDALGPVVPLRDVGRLLNRQLAYRVYDHCEALATDEAQALGQKALDWLPAEEMSALDAAERWWVLARKRPKQPPSLPRRRV